jgi:hypothetical protein
MSYGSTNENYSSLKKAYYDYRARHLYLQAGQRFKAC